MARDRPRSRPAGERPISNGAAELRGLPAVHVLLARPQAEALREVHGQAALTDAVRAALAAERGRRRGGESTASDDELLGEAAALLERRQEPSLRRVINASGIVLHTNLGRAPLAAEAMAAVAEVAGAYCNLELDLASGRRGGRGAALEPLVAELTGAEAALAVNNGAAAILLALSASAAGGEVVISRGELVEIGGGFRVPDVIRQGGARLVEVGSTNRTRIADYRDAIGSETRVLLKVHQSNFRLVGFAAETGIAELAALAREHDLAVVADLGSGLLAPIAGAAEPTLREALSAGADLVTCSGDKLLGGPQAGLIAGRSSAVEPLRKHPLMRALRLDKMALAALEATLRLHRDAPARVPVRRMLAQSPDATEARARRLQEAIGLGLIEPSEAFAGGGSLPEQQRPSHALVLEPACAVEEVSRRLRCGQPAVVARIVRNRLVIDLLAVADDEVGELAAAVRSALA